MENTTDIQYFIELAGRHALKVARPKFGYE
jgi:hypothetical protein